MTPMSKRDWWTGVFIVALALVLYAGTHRYEWMLAGPPSGVQQLIKLDRWTGRAYVVYPVAQQ